MKILNYIFKTLEKEFPNKISKIVINAFDDYVAFEKARELGYDNIRFISMI